MTRQELIRSQRLWADRERKARALWRSRQKRLDQDDPRRAQAFKAYRKAQKMRQKRDRQLAHFPISCMDAAGRRHLIREEGVRRYVYADSQGHATFGVGHLVHLGPPTNVDRRKWGTVQRPLSMKVVDSVLASDLKKYEDAVNEVWRAAPIKPTQSEYNACVSICFNIGIGGFKTSTIARRIRAGDRAGAAKAFRMWSRPPELKGRREREIALFLS